MMNVDIGEMIGEKVGDVLEIDADDDGWKILESESPPGYTQTSFEGGDYGR
jgi:hypothetical protein